MNFRMTRVATSVALAVGCQERKTESFGSSARPPPLKRGTVVVEATWTAAPPGPERFDIPPAAQKVCGPASEGPVLDLSGKALAGVVASWEGATTETPLAPKVLPSAVVDQKACRFLPPVLAATRGTQLTMLNSDPVIHNVRANASAETLFNVAMPLEGMTLKKTLDREGELRLRCDVHPWMRADIQVFSHSHFAMTDVWGRAVLEGLPAGKQRLRLWHPRLESKTLDVEVVPESETRVEASWDSLRP